MPTYPDRYHIIEDMKDRYPITWLTEMAKVERSGYYKWLKNGNIYNSEEAVRQAVAQYIYFYNFQLSPKLTT